MKSGKWMAPVGTWFLTWCPVELVTPSAQSPEGWQGRGISQQLNSCSLFLISLRDNNNGWIETGPDSQDRALNAPVEKIPSQFASTIVLSQTGQVLALVLLVTPEGTHLSLVMVLTAQCQGNLACGVQKGIGILFCIADTNQGIQNNFL